MVNAKNKSAYYDIIEDILDKICGFAHFFNYTINMTIFVFGNPDLAMDSIPIKILPQLQKKFPSIQFEVKDPNEEWDVPEELIIIDTVISGCDTSRLFNDLDEFVGAPQLTMHDFDALANLKYLKKLGILKKVRIIGLPPNISEKRAVESIDKILKEWGK